MARSVLEGEDLPVELEVQSFHSSCWAACGIMLINYFQLGPVEQCVMINRILRPNDTVPRRCCSDPPLPPNNTGCNVARDIENYSDDYRLFGIQSTFQPHLVDFATLKEEIQAGRPVMAGIEFDDTGLSGSNFHVVIIRGYYEDGSTQYVKVNNPSRPNGFVSIRDLNDVIAGRVSRDPLEPGVTGSWECTWTGIQKI